jgi:hypothetical protein
LSFLSDRCAAKQRQALRSLPSMESVHRLSESKSQQNDILQQHKHQSNQQFVKEQPKIIVNMNMQMIECVSMMMVIQMKFCQVMYKMRNSSNKGLQLDMESQDDLE